MVIKSGAVTKTKLSMLLYGEQFTGKSTLALQSMYLKREDGKPFRVLYIDAENGSIDSYRKKLVEDGIDVRNLLMVYTQSLEEVRECIKTAKEKRDFLCEDEDGNSAVALDAEGKPFRADMVIVDGTSILNMTTQQGLVEFSKKRNTVKANENGWTGMKRTVKIDGSGLEQIDWQKIKFRGHDLILDLMGSGLHFIATARETDEKRDILVDDNGKKKKDSVSTGKKIPEGFKKLEHNVNTVIRMFINEDGIVCADVQKDRSDVHPREIVEDPTLMDWQVVIDNNIGKPEFVIDNNLSEAVKHETEAYLKEIEKSDVGNDLSLENSDKEQMKDLREKINKIMASFSPIHKTRAKKVLSEKGLLISIKTITEIATLQEILEILEDYEKSITTEK